MKKTTHDLEQEIKKALPNDEYIAWATENRRVMRQKDRYYPSYHFRSPEQSMNDPNGLCFWQGYWHLFYQCYPNGKDGTHWGHAVSADLVKWFDLPPAISPGPEEGCWSGATYVDGNRVLAAYYGYQIGIMVAETSDPLLLNWTKITGKPVIPHEDADNPNPEFRAFDACIFKKDDLYYIFSGSANLHPVSGYRERNIFVFTSKDLIHWEYKKTLLDTSFGSYPHMDCACPYFMPIGKNGCRDILIHFSHHNGSQWQLGIFDKDNISFDPINGGAFNSNSWSCGGVHAPTAFPEGDDVVAIFDLCGINRNSDWSQLFGLPRRFSLYHDNNYLAQTPGVDLSSLHKKHYSVEETNLPTNEEVTILQVGSSATEIKAEFAAGDVPVIELRVLCSEDDREFTSIRLYRQRSRLMWERLDDLGWESAFETVAVLDTTFASESAGEISRPPESGTFPLDPSENFKLHIFTDNSTVEVFVNGKVCLSSRCCPQNSDPMFIKAKAIGKPATLLKLDAWDMDTIY